MNLGFSRTRTLCIELELIALEVITMVKLVTGTKGSISIVKISVRELWFRLEHRRGLEHPLSGFLGQA